MFVLMESKTDTVFETAIKAFENLTATLKKLKQNGKQQIDRQSTAHHRSNRKRSR
jgi:hypothetical protein